MVELSDNVLFDFRILRGCVVQYNKRMLQIIITNKVKKDKRKKRNKKKQTKRKKEKGKKLKKKKRENESMKRMKLLLMITWSNSSAEGRMTGFIWKHWAKKSLKISLHFVGSDNESAPFVAVWNMAYNHYY